MVESIEQNTEPKVCKENSVGESTKEKDFESQWNLVNNNDKIK